jgi:HSP20 family protein
MMMSLIKHETAKGELTPRRMDRLDRFFDEWPDMFHWPALVWPDRAFDSMRMEEFTENGSLVLRMEIPGIDPDKDVEISLQGDTLHVSAERRLEEETTGRDYVRQEMRYGSFDRDIPLPKGASIDNVHATYKNGILEVRVPLMVSEEEAPKRIPVLTS